jgi:hypothetical protein
MSKYCTKPPTFLRQQLCGLNRLQGYEHLPPVFFILPICTVRFHRLALAVVAKRVYGMALVIIQALPILTTSIVLMQIQLSELTLQKYIWALIWVRYFTILTLM